MDANAAAKLLNAETQGVTPDSEIARIKQEYEQRTANELKELAEYRKALEQEFAKLEPDDPKVAAIARRQVVSLVPVASSTLEYLLQHAESESVRMTLVKYVFDRAISQAQEESGDSELTKLIEKLTKSPA